MLRQQNDGVIEFRLAKSGDAISSWPVNDAGPEMSGSVGSAACSSVAGKTNAAASKSQRSKPVRNTFDPQLRPAPPRI